jgi:hypothetical protein
VCAADEPEAELGGSTVEERTMGEVNAMVETLNEVEERGNLRIALEEMMQEQARGKSRLPVACEGEAAGTR